jgi:hypothetical protein
MNVDPRGFYINEQGVVAPKQTVFNGGKRCWTRKSKKSNRKVTRKTNRKVNRKVNRKATRRNRRR